MKDKILLVEDEAIIAMTTAKMIGKHGYEVVTAHKGEKAVKIAEEDPAISLILMDIDLGRSMDGTEAAQKILEEQDIPIIFLTSHSEKEYVDRVKEITRYGYVLKNSGEFVLIESINMAYELFEANQHRKRHEQELENTVEALRATNENLLQKEEDLRENNRALRTLSECNQVLVRDNTESELVQEICEVIVEKAGYRLCWVGYIEGKGKERIIVPAARSGFGNDYVENLMIKVEVGPTSKGPTATAVRTKEPSVVLRILDNPDYTPWREAAIEHGYQSSIALPLMEDGEVFAVLNMYAVEAEVFEEEEKKLLVELSEDLSYGIRSIRTREEKEQNEKLLDNIIENIPIGLQIFDRDGYSYRINKKQKDLLGLPSKDEGIGEFNVLTDPYSIEHGADKLYRQVYNGDSFIDMENEYNFDIPVNKWETRKERRVFNESIFPVFTQDNQVGYVVSLLSDVTENRQMVEELKASEKKFSSLFNSMTEGVGIHQLLYSDSGSPYDYIIKDVNPAYEKILDLNKSEILDQLSTEVYHTKEPPFLKNFSEVIETKKPYQFETYYRPMNKHFLISVFPMGQDHFATVFMDVTEQKMKEENLRTTLHSIGDAVISTDTGGTITRMNPVAESLTGWSVDAAKGKSLDKVFHIIQADTRELVDNPVKKVLQTGEIAGLANHTALISKEGHEYQIADSAAPIKDDVGNINGVVLVFRDVTEEYEKERQIKKNAYLLEETQKLAHIGSWKLDLATYKLSWSDEVYRIFGLQPQEFGATYDAFLGAVHPEDREKVDEAYTDSIQQNQGGYEIEHRIVRRNTGEIRYVHEKCTHVKDENGKIIRSMGMVQDITHQKRAQEELRKSKDRYKRLVNNSPNLIMETDVDTHEVISCNPAMAKNLGTTIEDIIGRKIDEFIPSDILLKRVEVSQKAIDTGTVQTLDDERRGKYFHTTYIPVIHAERRSIQTITIDITDSKTEYEKLQETRKRFDLAIEGTGAGLWDWDMKSNRVVYSQKWKEMLGYEDHEIENSFYGWKKLWHPDDAARIERAMSDYLEGKTEDYEIIHRLLHKDGTWRWILTRGGILKDPEGNPYRWVGTNLDITNSKQNEEDLKKALEEKDYLMKELNHRVKNNLNLVTSLIDLKASETDEDLSDILNQVNAIRLIHEKLHQGEDVNKISIRQYLSDLLETVFSSFHNKDVEIHIDAADIALETKKTIPLGLIVNEIATNAIKHGFNDVDTPWFSVKIKDVAKQTLEIALSNSGNPFPKDIDIQRPDSLGLQLINTLVDQIGGTIELQREPNPVFTIRFPTEKESNEFHH
ncbi:MAG: PAS domain S-box protein [Spirochaetales bacterium]|nr:PAS domain S-box protein [Spirochaetales bacterium]MCF7937529.1 PAS domain S-box protein [Spirochaetales bacterium]